MLTSLKSIICAMLSIIAAVLLFEAPSFAQRHNGDQVIRRLNQAGKGDVLIRRLRPGEITNGRKRASSKGPQIGPSKRAESGGLGRIATSHQSGFELFDGADLPGGDFLSLPNSSLPQCMSGCRLEPNCTAFTFNRAKNVCFFKSTSGAPSRFADAVSGRKLTQPAEGGNLRSAAAASALSGNFQVFENADIDGGDLSILKNATAQQCQAACASLSQCAAYTHNISKGVCFLKSTGGEPTDFVGAVSGRKLPGETKQAGVAPKGKRAAGFVMFTNTDLPGGDGSILRQSVPSMEECQLECLFTDNCHAFAYNHAKRACFGKSSGHIGWREMKPTPLTGLTSGLKGTDREVAAARKRYIDAGPKVPEADLAWRNDDTAQAFVSRIRAAAKPMGKACNVERAQMEEIATSVKVKVSGDVAIAGKTIDVDWTAVPGQKALPIWLMISADDAVRFDAPGFYALTPKAIAPFGLTVDADRTRALTTLFGKGALTKGRVQTTVLEAGSLNLAVRAVGYLRACEEEFSQQIATTTIAVSPSGTPTFQVRDPFSFEKPVKVWLSPAGDTKLEVFDGRFRIVDLQSGAYIADREGRDPNYSPTGRFVTFLLGEGGNWVLDTVDGEVVTSTSPETMGWENEDSFLVAGASGLGSIATHSVLVKDVSIGGAPSCRVCPGRDESYVLDLENDVVHDALSKYVQRLSGQRVVSTIPGAGTPPTIRFIAEQTGAAPAYFPTRWNLRGGLKFVPSPQWIDTANGAKLDELQQEEKEISSTRRS